MIDVNVLLQLAKTFASLSLVAIGGANAVFPALRQAIVENMAWMDDGTFLQLFAIAQITPGPNVVVVSLLGWQIAGLPGLLVATLSMVLPAAILAFAVGRIANQVAGSAGFKLAQKALVPLAIGLLIAGGLDLAIAAPGGWFISVLVAVSALSVIYTKANPIWGMAASTIAALVVHYSGLVQLL
jgi:chromate transporter